MRTLNRIQWNAVPVLLISLVVNIADIDWLLPGGSAAAADVSLAVDVSHPAHPISPRLYGIFFEDINFGGDGGLNAELVKNGSFEFPQSLMGWSQFAQEGAKGEIQVAEADPAFAANPHFLQNSCRRTGRWLRRRQRRFSRHRRPCRREIRGDRPCPHARDCQFHGPRLQLFRPRGRRWPPRI